MTKVNELHKSKSELIEVVGHKDSEFSEKNATIKNYLDKTVQASSVQAAQPLTSLQPRHENIPDERDPLSNGMKHNLSSLGQPTAAPSDGSSIQKAQNTPNPPAVLASSPGFVRSSRGSSETGAILWDVSEVWMTRDKTFETWICPLVHSLLGYSSDVVLRLCQDLVLLKAEVAELLPPSVVVDVARRNDLDVNFHELISSQVYWLSLDYLHVAKLAVVSGSYFTSMMYVEYWCEEHFKGLTWGSPNLSHIEMLSSHIQILVSAVTNINEPDSLYGILQSYKLTTQIINFEHEGNWGKALEYYDLQVRSDVFRQEES